MTFRTLERVLAFGRGPRRLRPRARSGPVTLRNRTVKAATFEGRTPDGEVTDALIDYHLAVARGRGRADHGGLPRGRAGGAHAPRADRGRPGHRAGPGPAGRGDPRRPAPQIAGQVGHAGPVANGRSNGVHALSASRMPSPLSMQMIRPATERDLTRITAAYVDTARTLVRRRLRRARAAHGAQLPDLVVPRARAQPPQGPVRRLAGEPRPARPAGGPRRTRGGRRRGRGHREGQRQRRLPRRRDHRGGRGVRRSCSRPTATSTRCSSAAAAR